MCNDFVMMMMMMVINQQLTMISSSLSRICLFILFRLSERQKIGFFFLSLEDNHQILIVPFIYLFIIFLNEKWFSFIERFLSSLPHTLTCSLFLHLFHSFTYSPKKKIHLNSSKMANHVNQSIQNDDDMIILNK